MFFQRNTAPLVTPNSRAKAAWLPASLIASSLVMRRLYSTENFTN